MHQAVKSTAVDRPLIVDLDGTLTRTDLLVESFLSLLGKNPIAALKSLTALKNGKAALKAAIASQASIEMDLLPLDEHVVGLASKARAQGRPVYLVSAADERYVQALADHTGLFDGAIGSGNGRNLSGIHKAETLVQKFGEGGFDYVGNHAVDLHVWEKSGQAYLAGGSPSLARRVKARHRDAVILDSHPRGWRDYAKALRPHQWLKNLLVFAPAVAAHTVMEELPHLLMAFLAFSFCASSVYITNDLLDLSNDRRHPRKRNRPFASGAVPALHGIAIAIALLAVAAAIAVFLPWRFGVALLAYYALTTAYTLHLKRRIVADVLALACLYGIRIIAGGYASATLISPWLEAFAVFLFLSLALVKRCGELFALAEAGTLDAKGRGYRTSDIPVLEAMAVAAGYQSALVLSLYINFGAVDAYSYPHRLWLLCVVLLVWLSRIFVITRRGRMHDDPVVFAVRDRWSLVMGGVAAAIVASAMM